MERSFWSTIRGKLLSRTLAVVLVPALLIGGVAIAALRSLSGTADGALADARSALSEEVVGAQVATTAEQVARELAIFLDERVADVDEWSTDIGLITGADAAGGRANVRRLPERTVDELEEMFAENPRLSDVHVERDLLNSVKNRPAFKEIFLTDVNGFVVDYTNQTSDFVQSDELWWQGAMDTGSHISEPEFDASAGVMALDIAFRVDDEDRPVGVIKAALDINVAQVIADRFAANGDSVDITIVDAAGRFIAETSSGHDVSHIMNPLFVATNPATSTALVREVFQFDAAELHADGYSITDEGVGGFAHVGDQLAALRGDTRDGLDTFDWTVVVEQPANVAFASLAPLEGLANEVSSTSSTLTILLSLTALAGVAIAAYMALVFARRLTSPIARLRDAAMKTAEVTLPNVVAQIDELEEDEELPELERFVLKTGDEVEDLAHSFNTVQQTAADLASDQARMRRKNVATMFVNLGRRNQNLLSRQLEHINSMEVTETNAKTLERLFQLDHLATRMRRNAESLLVLAGEETPRRFRQPVSMYQVLQAAGGEIEDFSRIEVTSLDDASVEGAVASDLAHLLAELLENASSYSPPDAPIQVHGRRRQNSYSLSIVDQGIGMEAEDLESANRLLADPVEFDRAPSAYLGHYVVGHLAKRHGVQVQLVDSPYGGLGVQLRIPSDILAVTDSSNRPSAQVPPAPKRDIYEEAEIALTASEQAQIEAFELALMSESATANRVEGPAAPAPVVNERVVHPDAAEPIAGVPVTASAASAAVSEPTISLIDEPPVVIQTGTDASETTPSGFRKRRRGQEGAPSALTTSNRPEAAVARRDPQEVHASLQRFRLGVEAGRVRNANHHNANRDDTNQTSEGDAQ